jgi:hypothetical protein
MGNARLDPDERAERTGQRRQRTWRERQEIRPRRRNTIAKAGDVMTQFMAAENRQNREAVPQPVQIETGLREKGRDCRSITGEHCR